MSAPAQRRARSRRGTRDVLRVVQSPWRQPVNSYPPAEILEPGQVVAIHEASLRILEELGIDFLLPEACDLLRRAGAEVDGQRVRLDRGLVMAQLAHAPREFILHARNPERNLVIGARHLAFCSVASAPNVSDRERGRRSGNFADYCDLVRLMQSLNCVHLHGGYPVEPADLPPETRHLDALAAFATLSDKVFHAYALGRTRIRDALEIVRIARGIDRERLQREPSLFTIVNASSPLRLDGPMLEGLIEMARHNQAVVLTPFTLAGAMAPVTLAGALAQQNAEALAGIVLTQVVRPGAPAVYGGFTSNVDMKSGSPAFGTPEYLKTAQAGGQLARHYGLPYRSSNVNAANSVDAQAAYESTFSLWGAVSGHCNLLMHGAGWLEGGLCASFEKVMLDAELLQMVQAWLEPIAVDEDSLALEALREVGPGGHFFGCAHTLERYEHAFHLPLISDWRNHESWTEAGAPDATDHAHRLYRQLLAEYRPPPLEEAVCEALEDFVERRRREGGAPPV
ncbi:MAG: trimethylamine methyltransferase family protein [Candidatus Competibacterales bacterium]|nr:trimethylamine methyltransferase family protein [Candidatus Competibacterales bacterium]